MRGSAAAELLELPPKYNEKDYIVILLLIGYVEISSAQLFGPRDYDECIIEGMQELLDVAANAVQLRVIASLGKANRQTTQIMKGRFQEGLDGGTERLT